MRVLMNTQKYHYYLLGLFVADVVVGLSVFVAFAFFAAENKQL